MELDGQVGLFAEEPMPEADGDGTITEDGITLMRGDCLELMPKLPGGSVDLILCDLPYGTTECAWDSVIPFEPLWREYWRMAKPRAAVVLFGAEPFSTKLRNSAFAEFKYDWVWIKNAPVGGQTVRVRPLRAYELVSVFSRGTIASGSSKTMNYFPQGLVYCGIPRTVSDRKGGSFGPRPKQTGISYVQEYTNWPTNVLQFSHDAHRVHPTQKPTALLRYLIKTYTREGDVVLDNCMGSGSTGVAARQTGRRFIGIEQDAKYFEIARRRIFSAEAEQGEKE